MKKTFPEDRQLDEPERLRIFKRDKARIKRAAQKWGVEDDEAKRRAIHVGLNTLSGILGIDEKEAA